MGEENETYHFKLLLYLIIVIQEAGGRLNGA